MKRAFLLIAVVAMLLSPAVQAGVDVTPYGFVLLNTSYNTRSITDIPVTAAPPSYDPSVTTAEPNFVLTPRQSRLGLKMKSDAKYSPTGAIEMDFWGLRGSGPNGGPTQSAPRLRRAFMEIHFEKFDLLAGQEWMVLSPLSPSSIMHVSLVPLMSSGNLWARLPQIRGTFRPLSNDKNEVKVQLALIRPFGADARMNGVRVDTTTGTGAGGVSQADAFGRGEKFGWPWAQGRIGFATKGEKKIGVGASFHYGMEDFGNDPAGDDITGTSMALSGDVKLGLGKITISGEGFVGQNIKSLFSTATFAMVPDTLVVDGERKAYKNVEEIKSVGGWGEVKLAVTPKVDVAVSGGVEAIEDEFLVRSSETVAGPIKTNTTIVGNVFCKVTKGVLFALEVGYINTERVTDLDINATSKETDGGRKNLNVNFSAMYKF